KHNNGEPEPGVFGVVARDELRLRFGKVKRSAVALGKRSDKKYYPCKKQEGHSENIPGEESAGLVDANMPRGNIEEVFWFGTENALLIGDLLQIQRLRKNTNAEHCQAKRYFIGDQLCGRPHGAQHAVLVVRTPARD